MRRKKPKPWTINDFGMSFLVEIAKKQVKQICLETQIPGEVSYGVYRLIFPEPQ